jgi:nucleoside-diphosphate-sugar epimerase
VDAAPDVEVIVGDLADAAGLRRAAAGTSAVVHLAAAFGHPDVDVAASAALAAAWAESCPGGFVFVSTVDVYGRPRHVPVAEDHPLDAAYSDYARGKIRCEEFLLGHGRDDVTILRPPYVWGPHPYCRWQLRTAAGHAFYRALQEGTPIRLPGADRAESAAYGHAWVDARELAAVVCASLDSAGGEVLNVVNGHFSWVDLYDLLGELTGRRPGIRYGAPADDFHHVVRRYDTTRLAHRFGFTPAYQWRDTLWELFAEPAP